MRTQIDEDCMTVPEQVTYSTKVCSGCKSEKHVSDFGPRLKGADGLESRCRECCNTKARLHSENNIEAKRLAVRNSSLKRRYGLTSDQYQELLTKQDNRCAICERGAEEFNRRLAVDHDHKTGQVRGLLCLHCNHKLVGNHTNGDLLRKIADYVEQGTGWFVPPKRPRKRKKKT